MQWHDKSSIKLKSNPYFNYLQEKSKRTKLSQNRANMRTNLESAIQQTSDIQVARRENEKTLIMRKKKIWKTQHSLSKNLFFQQYQLRFQLSLLPPIYLSLPSSVSFLQKIQKSQNAPLTTQTLLSLFISFPATICQRSLVFYIFSITEYKSI